MEKSIQAVETASRRDVLAGSALGVTAGIAGCLGGRSDGDDDVIRFSYTQGTEFSAPYSVYLDSDFFRSEVLPNAGEEYEIELTGTDGTSHTASGLGADEFDGGLLAFSSMATAVAEDVVPEGLRIVFPTSWQLQSDLGFAERFAALEDSGISEMADLKGVDLAINAYGSGADIAARAALEDHGIDPEEDLTLREVEFGAMESMLREGQIDVATFVQPMWESVRDDATTVFDFTESFGDFLPFFCVFKTDFLEENPDMVRAFVEDNWKAIQWLTDDDNREKAIDIVNKQIDLDRDLLEVSMFDRGYYWSQDGYRMQPEYIQPGIDGMSRTGFLDEPVDVEPYIDNSYLPDEADTEPDVNLSL